MNEFKQNIKSILLGLLIIFIFLFIIKPAYLTIKNIPYIKAPLVGDYFIVNRKKIEKTPYGLNGEKEYRHGGYTIFRVKAIDGNNVTFNFNTRAYSPYSYAKKLLNKGAAYDPKYYSPANELIIPKKQLVKLNLFRTIVSVHRTEDSQATQHYKFAQYLYAERKYLEASKHFRQIAENSPSYQPYYDLGNSLYKAKLYNEARQAYLTSAPYRKEKAQPLHMAALCYARQENYLMAIDYYKQAIDVDPQHLQTYVNLASIYGKIGNTKKSMENYKISIDKRTPSKAVLLNYMECVLVEGGNYQELFDAIAKKKNYFKDSSFMMSFDMLKILFLVEEGSDVSTHLDKWHNAYSSNVFTWDFTILNSWDSSESFVEEGKRKKYRKEIIRFFEAKKTH